MRPRRSFNPKRRLLSDPSPEQRDHLLTLAERVRYGGNPEHKRNPGDFGLQPPSHPRLGKSLCDELGVFTREVALELLREGLRRGVVSVAWDGDWPKNIWAVFEGCAVEAQREALGVYHGYPMPDADPLATRIRNAWG